MNAQAKIVGPNSVGVLGPVRYRRAIAASVMAPPVHRIVRLSRWKYAGERPKTSGPCSGIHLVQMRVTWMLPKFYPNCAYPAPARPHSMPHTAGALALADSNRRAVSA